MYSSSNFFSLDFFIFPTGWLEILVPLRMLCGLVSTPVTNPLPLPKTVTDVGCTSAAGQEVVHRAKLACTGSGMRCRWD
jgi:hypothetical protein